MISFKKHIFTILLVLLVCVGASAQPNESNGVIYIKVGNLLRRGKQHDLSEYYIKKGLDLVKGKDKFWEASAYENLGLLYRDMGDEERMSKYLLNAINIYTTEKNILAEKAASDLLEGKEPNKELFSDFNLTPPKSAREAFMYIKTGNVLVEAKQFDLAKKCIEAGLKLAQGSNDYWEASAYEYLGMLGWDKNDNQMSIQYYNLAFTKFNKLGNEISTAVIKDLLKRVEETEEFYGGIEIGSKGIKANVIGVSITKEGQYKFNVKYNEFDNTVSLAPSKAGGAIEEKDMTAASTVVRFYYDKMINDYAVLPNRFFVVGSSAISAASNKEALRKKILSQFTETQPVVDFVTAEKETELSIIGCVPNNVLLRAALVDVGSGNTKVGCYLPEEEKRSYSFSLPYGAETLKEQVLAEVKATKGNFNNIAKQKVRAQVEPELTKGITKSAALQGRKDIYLTGGASWAMVTYLYPEKANEPFVEVNSADLGKFRDLAALSYDKLTNPDINKIPADVKEKAMKDIQTASTEVFDKEGTIAGSLLLATVGNALNPKGDRKFIFARGGVSGWISGYTIQYIAESYKRLKEVKE